jgi:hypothetical protein
LARRLLHKERTEPKKEKNYNQKTTAPINGFEPSTLN